MRNEIEIRKANEADHTALAVLVAEKDFDYPTDAELLRERLIDLLSLEDLILVAVYDAEIVGMILLHQTRFLHRSPDGRIISLVVTEKSRNAGIGKLLVEEAEKFLKFGVADASKLAVALKEQQPTGLSTRGLFRSSKTVYQNH